MTDHRQVTVTLDREKAQELLAWTEDSAIAIDVHFCAKLRTALQEGEGEDGAITVYRRMKAAAEGARAERDIMRAAVEVIADGPDDPCGVAQDALDADRERREANLAALAAHPHDQEASQREPSGPDPRCGICRKFPSTCPIHGDQEAPQVSSGDGETTDAMVDAAIEVLDGRGWVRENTSGIPAYAHARADVRAALDAALVERPSTLTDEEREQP